MFNDYVWQIYLHDTGNNVASFFEKNLTECYSKEYANKICEFHMVYCPSRSINKFLYDELIDVYEETEAGTWFLKRAITQPNLQ